MSLKNLNKEDEVMGTKICYTCKRELTIDNFCKNLHNKDGLNTYCRECVKEVSRKYRETTLIDKTEYNKKYRLEHKPEILAYEKRYRETHVLEIKMRGKRHREKYPEYSIKYREEHKEYIAKWHKENYKNNHGLEYHTMMGQRRRSRMKELGHTLTIKQWKQIKIDFNNKCAYCNRELPLNQEHFISVVNYGEYTVNNIIPSCKSCNSSKGIKDFFEWYPKHKYYSKRRENKILKYLHYDNGIQQLKII